MSPVHNTKPVLSCFFGKPQPDLLAHPISPRRNTRFPPPPGYTIRSELCIEVQCSHLGMHVDLNFIGSLCFALSHAVRARYSSFNSKPDQSRAEGKASSTENGNKSFSENFSFSLKTLGVWFAVIYSFLTPSLMFSIGNLFFCWKMYEKTQCYSWNSVLRYSYNSITHIMSRYYAW